MRIHSNFGDLMKQIQKDLNFTLWSNSFLIIVFFFGLGLILLLCWNRSNFTFTVEIHLRTPPDFKSEFRVQIIFFKLALCELPFWKFGQDFCAKLPFDIRNFNLEHHYLFFMEKTTFTTFWLRQWSFLFGKDFHICTYLNLTCTYLNLTFHCFCAITWVILCSCLTFKTEKVRLKLPLKSLSYSLKN